MFNDGCKEYWNHADVILFHDALHAWCDGSTTCMAAKKYALLTMLEKGVVNYRRADGKTFQTTVYELAEKQKLLVDKASFLEWASSVSDDGEMQLLQEQLKVSPRRENANLAIIGALLDLFFEVSATGKPYSLFKSQADVIDKVVQKYEFVDGISQRNLEDKFAQANKHLSSS